MGQSNKETRDRLLESAQEEFLKYGFDKASLRSICKNAGVTTGAMYFIFKNKDDLFASLLQPFIDEIIAVVQDHFKEEAEIFQQKREMSVEEELRDFIIFLDFFYAHPEIGQLIIDNLEHPVVALFIDDLIDLFTVQNTLIFQEFDRRRKDLMVDEQMIHWIAHAQVERFLFVLKHDLSKEEALEQLRMSLIFFRGGFGALMGRK